MTPADRERIEAVCREQVDAHDLGGRDEGCVRFDMTVESRSRAACRNVAMAAHELGRESALGEIETALRELARAGFESLSADLPTESASGYVVGLHRFNVGARPEVSRTDNTFFEALLAAIDAVNEMRAATALANRGVL